MPRLIANDDLTLRDLPSPDAGWEAIQGFALSFDGYKEAGSLEHAARIANDRVCETLTDLRVCLFFEQRRWRHFGVDPDETSMTYIHSLLEQISDRIGAKRAGAS
jgi:hypothetical protein